MCEAVVHRVPKVPVSDHVVPGRLAVPALHVEHQAGQTARLGVEVTHLVAQALQRLGSIFILTAVALCLDNHHRLFSDAVNLKLQHTLDISHHRQH